MLELYYAHRLLKVGGLLVMHDIWMPSVQKTIHWATSNLAFARVKSGMGKNMAFMVKTQTDHREWNHFVAFN